MNVTKQFHHKITYPLSYNGLRRLGDLGNVNVNFTIPTCGLVVRKATREAKKDFLGGHHIDCI